MWISVRKTTLMVLSAETANGETKRMMSLQKQCY